MVISFPESWSGKLGGTDSLISVRPKCYKRETESLLGHVGETEICIGVTEVLGFLAVGMLNELGGAR